jgi:hypothetical protein
VVVVVMLPLVLLLLVLVMLVLLRLMFGGYLLMLAHASIGPQLSLQPDTID